MFNTLPPRPSGDKQLQLDGVVSLSLNHPGLNLNKFLNTIEPNANPKPMYNNGRIATLSFAIKNTIITIIAEVENKNPIIIAVFFFILISF
jgi:hypothetical protein